MMLQLPAGPSTPDVWPRAAIHDSVAAIARQSEYARSVRTSLLERFFNWLGSLLDALARALGGMPNARRVTVVVVILLALLVVARIAYAARLRAEAADAVRRQTARRPGAVDPWREAQRLAAEGRFTDAAHALYRSLVETVARREQLRVHIAKTSGDYARELRTRASPAYAPFRHFGRRYDHIIFGIGSCDAAGYQALLDDARPVLAAVEGARAA